MKTNNPLPRPLPSGESLPAGRQSRGEGFAEARVNTISDRFYYDFVVAGFGGQGVMVIGNLLAYAAMKEGKYVTYLPVYGVEMRGGTANCTVVISSRPIGSPVVGRPHAALVMNLPSLTKYGPLVLPNGLLFINSSLIEPKEAYRKDVENFLIPVNQIAIDHGQPKLANMVALGAFNQKTELVQITSLFDSLEKVLDEKYRHLIPSNIEAIKVGADFVRDNISVPARYSVREAKQ